MADDPQSVVGAAVAAGIDPTLAQSLPRIIQIESGGNPTAQTGSYTGLLQMGPQERAQYGGDGLDAGLSMLRDRANQFAQKFGRQPDPTEFYLTHQQGLGGIAAHMANPDAPAWQNMASTAEGRRKGDEWAKTAIWGNVPTDVRGQFPGGRDSLTSQQFMDLWRAKVERGQPSAPAAPLIAPPAPPQFAQAPGISGAISGGISNATSSAYGMPGVPPGISGGYQAPISGAAPLSAQGMGQLQGALRPFFGGGVGGGSMASASPTALPAMEPAPALQFQIPPAWRPAVRGAIRPPFLGRG